jgi:hypothetical protein
MSDPWTPKLDPDERVLWTGAPARDLRFPLRRVPRSLAGLLTLGFALFWTALGANGLVSGAWRTEQGFTFWLLILLPLTGLPILAFGLYETVGHVFYDARTRARTRYALTNRRALIALDGKKPSLTSWPIQPDTVVNFEEGAEATIYFATESSKDSEGSWTHTRVGFEFIADGDKVYRLIRQLQTGTA